MTMIKFNMPRAVDDDALDKMMVTSYRDERCRRVKSVDDEFRDKIPTNLPTGTFRLADISMHEPIEERAVNELGGLRVPLNQNYVCPHCGMEYAMAIPPEECVVCHRMTWFGELVAKDSFKR